ncbi:hypothetical protein GF377_10365 [candidate division GN15 bacterium]|nr:hypothetical protein [candidate division GN15 bacterium]
MHLTLKEIALAGLIAAVYTVLGLVFLPISFGVYQVRIAEAITVLPFLTRAAVPGLFIGCMLANVFGGLGWQDIVLGSLITLLAAVVTRLIAKMSRNGWSTLLSFLPVVLLWGGGVAVLNAGEARWLSIGLAAVSLALLIAGGIVSRRPTATEMALAILSLTAAAGVVFFAEPGRDAKALFIGCVALAAAWILTHRVIRTWRMGNNPNEIIAPLPPVLFNAFGVSLYLAPIIDVNYWFAVQMVGVGQLVACYLLGLPLLRLLSERKSLFAPS